MCGRFTLRTPALEIAQVFDLPALPTLPPRFNIAPTQAVAAIRVDAGHQRQFAWLHWGLIPFWAEEPSIGNRLINARGETVASKPAFRQAFQRRRCLILADGFFEWQKAGSRKQPQYIRLKTGRPFAMAGLWESWNRTGQVIESCTIITTTANELMQPIHDRMPVILPPEAHSQWLASEAVPIERLEALLRPCPSDLLLAHPVSTLVNNPRNDVADCIAAL